MDDANVIERFFEVLQRRGVTYCLIGGQAVNAYVDPVVSLDLDVVVAAGAFDRLEETLATEFSLERFAHSLNVSAAGSDLRVQIQTDPRYASFVERATVREVLGHRLSVAAVEDVLQGKIWAAQDPSRQTSKRLKDLAGIARLLETHPTLRSQVPEEILARIV